MKTVYLVRHGETDYSQMNIVQGQTDVPLNGMGIQTIQKMSEYIANHLVVCRVFTSDLLRCRQTCEIIIDKLPYSVDCVITEVLREISLGIFEGQPMEKLNYFRYESGDYNSFVPDGGESFNQLITRIKGWFLSNFIKLNETMIISHRGPISVIVEGAENCDDYEMDTVLKQGNIIELTLFSEKNYRIEKIIEVVKEYD